MKIACARGCGDTIEVTKKALREMIDLGQDIVVSHEVCPTEVPEDMRVFRIVTQVFEIINPGLAGEEEEKVAQMGDSVEAVNFREAVEALGKALNAQWAQIVGMADTIDGVEPDPFVSEADEGEDEDVFSKALSEASSEADRHLPSALREVAPQKDNPDGSH